MSPSVDPPKAEAAATSTDEVPTHEASHDESLAAEPRSVTSLLRAWVEEEDGALDRLIPIVLPELRRLAHHHLAREGSNHTLQPTEVIHEAFLRLVRTRIEGFDSRGHFFALSSRLIRQILVEHARARRRLKRGGEHDHVSLEEVGAASAQSGPSLDEILTVDQLLSQLRDRDPRQSRVIEMRFFAGLTLKEIAGAMSLSLATVERLWSVGRRRLAVALEGDSGAGEGAARIQRS